MNFIKYSKLMGRTIFFPILIVVIAIIAIALFFTVYISNQTLNSLISTSSQDVRIIIKTFDGYINSTVNLTKIFSNSFEAQGGDIDSLLLNLKRALNNDNLYLNAFVSDYKGYCKDANGKTFYLSPQSNDLLKNNTVVVKIVRSAPWEDGGLPVLRVGSPINIYGNFQGGVFFDISLDGKNSKIFNFVVNASKIKPNGYGFVLTPQGTTIIHKNINFIWKNITKVDFITFEKSLTFPLPNILKYTMYGKNKIAVGLTDPITNLKFYVTAYKSSILNTVDKTMFYIILSFVIVAIILAVFLFIQINPITNAILKINNVLKKISKGNYDLTVETSSKTEIDDIANNLNIMSKQIKCNVERVHNLKFYMESILNSLNEIIITTDEKGDIKFSNDYAKDIFEPSINGLSIIDLIEKNNLNIYFEIESIIENKEILYFPDVHIGDKIFDVYIKTYTSLAHKGIIFIAYNITKRVELESHLSQIQRMQSIELMAGSIAHDFNNFLGGMLGYLELFETSDSEVEKNSYITKLYSSIYEAKNMVNKLLVFTNDTISSKEIVNFKESLQEAIDMLKVNIEEKGISLNLDRVDPDIKLEINKTELMQILTNLLINSLQAIEDVGTITVKTQALHLDKKSDSLNIGDYVKILINDNGSGIEEKYLNSIFDPFFTMKKSGTGLGLYIVKSLVEKNSGSIKVFSKVGIGTTFEIYLPLYSGNITEKAETDSKYIYGHEQRILLVDDDNVVRNVTKKMLEKLNYFVYDAENGEEALDILQNNGDKIGLILLDIVMPKKDGREFMSFMYEHGYDIPVVIISGFATDISNIKKYTFYKDFLPKPFGMKTLSIMVAKHIKQGEI